MTITLVLLNDDNGSKVLRMRQEACENEHLWKYSVVRGCCDFSKLISYETRSYDWVHSLLTADKIIAILKWNSVWKFSNIFDLVQISTAAQPLHCT